MSRRRPGMSRVWVWIALLTAAGCGQTRSQLATEQMLASDAVDRSVSGLDLSPLTDKTVYFDTQYIRNVKGAGFVNADYIISSVRQQLFAFGCRLQDDPDDAEVVVEGRVGVLGIDDHEITYGMPASNTLNSAASAVGGAALPLPALPELSIAKKNEQIGAAKVALFAYDRETRQPLWQSGVATSMSDSDAFWVLGAGPFRRGTIYNGMQFAGSRMRIPKLLRNKQQQQTHAMVGFQRPVDFQIRRPERLPAVPEPETLPDNDARPIDETATEETKPSGPPGREPTEVKTQPEDPEEDNP